MRPELWLSGVAQYYTTEPNVQGLTLIMLLCYSSGTKKNV